MESETESFPFPQLQTGREAGGGRGRVVLSETQERGGAKLKPVCLAVCVCGRETTVSEFEA